MPPRLRPSTFFLGLHAQPSRSKDTEGQPGSLQKRCTVLGLADCWQEDLAEGCLACWALLGYRPYTGLRPAPWQRRTSCATNRSKQPCTDLTKMRAKEDVEDQPPALLTALGLCHQAIASHAEHVRQHNGCDTPNIMTLKNLGAFARGRQSIPLCQPACRLL